MTSAPASTSAHDAALRRRVNHSVFVNYLLSNFGYYTVLPVLPILLVAMGLAESWFIGVALFTLAFAIRASVLFISAVMYRVTARTAISGGLLLAAVGFGLLSTFPGRAGVLVCLAVAGLGISANTLMARAYVAARLSEPGARNTAFSYVQVAVNLAAAVGPIVANLVVSAAGRALPLLVAALYLLGAAVTAVVVPGRVRPGEGDHRRPHGLAGLRTIALDPAVRRIAVVSVAGWFLYGQLFSALSVHIGALTDQPLLRSSFFTVNAVLVILVQLPVSALAARRLDAGARPWTFLCAGVLMFGGAFVVLAVSGSYVAGTFAGVAVFSVAETVFTPFVATAFAGISADRSPIEVFNLLQIVMAVGESLGALAGGSALSALSGVGFGALYWVALAVLALLAGGPVLLRRRAHPGGSANPV